MNSLVFTAHIQFLAFISALQQTGRNPNRSTLDKYWPYGTGKRL